MPTYLLHGFRWDRTSIRIHIALHNLDDAAAEWIVAPATSITLLNSFYTLFDFLPPSNPLKGAYTLPPVNGDADDEGSVEPQAQQAAKPYLEAPVLQPLSPMPRTPRTPQESGAGGEERKTLKKKNTKSSGSLRMFRERKAEKPPETPDLPKELGAALRQSNGSMGHAAGGSYVDVGTINENSAEQRPRGRSVSDSMERPGTDTSAASWRTQRNGMAGKKKVAFNDWSVVKLVEQYDPQDLYASMQPWAYVADHVVEVRLGVSIADEVGLYEAKVKEEVQDATQGPVGMGSSESESTYAADLSSPTARSTRDLRRMSRRLNWFEKLRDELQKEAEMKWYVVVCGDEERAYPVMDPEMEKLSEESDEGSVVLSRPKSAGFRGFFRRKGSDQNYR